MRFEDLITIGGHTMIRINVVLAAILSLSLGSTAGEPCRTVVRVGTPSPAAISADAFDHTPWDQLLCRFVSTDGMVAYGGWTRDHGARIQLYRYLEQFGRFDPNLPASAEGTKALYINAYNALVVHGILCAYPTPSIQKHQSRRGGYRIFDDLELAIGDEYLSLNAIENDVLRPMGDFRIHFGLVCAAQGCPQLRRQAYWSHTLDEQLTQNARDFFARQRAFALHRCTRTAKVSPILLWFREDFGKSDAEVLAAISGFLAPADALWIVEHFCQVKLRFQGYDWSLNDRCPSLAQRTAYLPYKTYACLEPSLRPIIAKFASDEAEAEACPVAEADRPEEQAEPAPVRLLAPEPVQPEPTASVPSPPVPSDQAPPPPRILKPTIPKPAPPRALNP